LGRWAIVSFAIVCVMFIVHTMPRHWVYLKMGLPDAYDPLSCLIAEVNLTHPGSFDCAARARRA